MQKLIQGKGSQVERDQATSVPKVTSEALRACLPKKFSKSIPEEVLTSLEDNIQDPHYLETMRENLVSHGSILLEGKWSVDQYLKAIKFISLRGSSLNLKQAYSLTFPERYARYLAKNTNDKDIASVMSVYARSKLVMALTEQMLIPAYILNLPTYQKAINVLANLMVNAKTERSRIDSATAILTHLKAPETHKIDLNIGVQDDSILKELRDVTSALVANQSLTIKEGINDATDIIEGELIAKTSDTE